jgi:hypothetical protein
MSPFRLRTGFGSCIIGCDGPRSGRSSHPVPGSDLGRRRSGYSLNPVEGTCHAPLAPPQRRSPVT